ncbi:SDR family NAD(P)-dependent oxidoreductase [Bacteroidota bacterium]
MKKAIIIGASSGIGRELAVILVNNNYKVGITGRRKELLDELKKTNKQGFIIKVFDASKDDNTGNLEELVDELSGLDLLVISSGTGDLNPELDFSIEKKTIDLNVTGFTEIATWAFNYFEKQKYGHLIAISSIAGIRGSRLATSYYATKAYQINYIEGLRQKAKKIKMPIYVSDIRPGLVDTDMAKGDGQFWVAKKEVAAKQIYNIIKRKKDIAYVTKRWRIIAMLLKILPNWIYNRM